VTNQALIDATEWSVNLSFWASAAFPVLIAPVWRWWLDWFGQTMVLFDLALAGAALGLVLRFDWGIRLEALQWVDIISLSFAFVVIVWRSVLIYRTQRHVPPPGAGEKRRR
jgi:hypothetical protein